MNCVDFTELICDFRIFCSKIMHIFSLVIEIVNNFFYETRTHLRIYTASDIFQLPTLLLIRDGYYNFAGLFVVERDGYDLAVSKY